MPEQDVDVERQSGGSEDRGSLQCGKVLHATRFPGDSFINSCQRLTRAYSSTQTCTEKNVWGLKINVIQIFMV